VESGWREGKKSQAHRPPKFKTRPLFLTSIFKYCYHILVLYFSFNSKHAMFFWQTRMSAVRRDNATLEEESGGAQRQGAAWRCMPNCTLSALHLGEISWVEIMRRKSKLVNLEYWKSVVFANKKECLRCGQTLLMARFESTMPLS
jgi:ribosomal protein S27AE